VCRATIKKIDKAIEMAKMKFKPSFNFGGYFQYVDGRGWGIDGGYVEVGLDEPAYAKSPPYPFAIPPIPIPFLARGEARLEELAIRLAMMYRQQLELSGSLTMYPAIRGAIGLRVSCRSAMRKKVKNSPFNATYFPTHSPSFVLTGRTSLFCGSLMIPRMTS